MSEQKNPYLLTTVQYLSHIGDTSDLESALDTLDDHGISRIIKVEAFLSEKDIADVADEVLE